MFTSKVPQERSFEWEHSPTFANVTEHSKIIVLNFRSSTRFIFEIISQAMVRYTGIGLGSGFLGHFLSFMQRFFYFKLNYKHNMKSSCCSRHTRLTRSRGWYNETYLLESFKQATCQTGRSCKVKPTIITFLIV